MVRDRLFYISSGTSLIPPKIKIALIRSLEHHGWDADTQIECPSYTYGSPLEDLTLTAEQREEIIQTQRRRHEMILTEEFDHGSD